MTHYANTRLIAGKAVRITAILFTLVAVQSAFAQAYPTRPIRFIVPYPPGGTTDFVARAFAEELTKVLRQPIVVENKSGAAGSLGTETVARSAPDGYTIGLSSVAPFAVNPACNPKNVPYDPVADFRAITEIASSPHAILVNSAFPARNYAEFLALIKAKPDGYSFATAGTCGTGHMLGASFMYASHTHMLHVPYRGAGPAGVDVAAGHVPILIDGLPSTLPQVKAGRLRAIVIASPNRSEAAPEVPTFGEVGLEEVNDPSWYGLVAPAGTPDAIVWTLYDASTKALQQPVILERFRQAGAIAGGRTPEQHADQIRRTLARMRLLVKEQNIKPD